ncbi:predicted ATPase of the PP-loop superfamily implicated in cell cycle control [Hahella chejuensis KCTC 2396]|uniref:tRNA(Ile)-lysidine synthase n=1 Tax=Hahella chejuensis (strain KCTC 2396) TaxID=349521 RepID=Q2SKX4_HAHCH|nr:tRNA lysidine(34) synthetase TilS [Hahella chejuensis]ABC28700.1 predicted ATPase of the PP-loop superfamily implicated in cell cycle control [Hahella chejuensis KCTC 2396]
MTASSNTPHDAADIERRLLSTLCGLPDFSRLFIAYSGGLDSSVLLHAARRAWPAKTQIEAIHVHHGLSPNADAWAEHCQKECQSLDVACHAHHVSVMAVGDSLEAAAREARYRVFERYLSEHADAVLLQGHHQNDQAETILFRLLKGHGVKGLAGIPRQRTLGKGILRRPLLDFTRLELEALAQRWGLSWVEDESNVDAVFDRNFLRNEILRPMSARWRNAVAMIAETGRRMSEASSLLDELAEIDLQGETVSADELELAVLSGLSPHRRKNVLRYWLQAAGLTPSESDLAEILAQMLHAEGSRQPCYSLGESVLRRHDGKLYLTEAIDAPPSGYEAAWSLEEALLTPVGKLIAEPAHEGVRQPTVDETVIVRFRRGGERFRPKGRGGSRPLKKWLQEQDIPPWRRDRIPLIYFNDELAAVGNYGVAEQFAASANAWLPSLKSPS